MYLSGNMQLTDPMYIRYRSSGIFQDVEYFIVSFDSLQNHVECYDE